MAPALLGDELIYLQGGPVGGESQPRGPHAYDRHMDRAVRFTEFGGPEVLELVPLQPAEPGPGQVRVRMVYAGLNPVDYKIRRGGGGYATTLPSGLGRELSGFVESTGAGVQVLAAGDAVFGTIDHGSPSGGALADTVVVDERVLAFLPDALGFDVAAGLGLAGQTAWDALASQELAAGDTVLVSAAAGGVGGIIAQLAVHAGMRVVGSASPGNHAWLRSRGVEPVAYGDGFVDAVRALVPDGATAAFDLHGREAVQQFLALGLAPERINSNAMGAAVPPGVQRVGRGAPSPATLATLAALVIDGALDVPIAGRFDLADVADAYRLLEGGHLRGKVVVRGSDGDGEPARS